MLKSILMVINCMFFYELKFTQSCTMSKSSGLRMLKCSKMNLKEFPKDIDNSTEFLRLEKNFIEDIPKHFSNILPNLVKIDIAYNRIKTLEANVFSNFKKLNTIQLQDNKITTINNDIFKGLESTTMKLRLTNNSIATIHPNAFSRLYADTDLFLNINNISSLHPETFVDVRWMIHLDLDDNHLNRLPETLFQNQEKLLYLSLRKNLISSLSENTFIGLDSLENIDLSHNKLTSLPSQLFSKNNKLQIINLESNLLTRIPIKLPFSVIEVKLKDNPIVCDCELKAMLLNYQQPSILKDFDNLLCQNHANLTTKQVLQELFCETTTTPKSLLSSVSTLKITSSTGWRTMLAIILSAVVLLVMVVLFIFLYRKCILKTGHQFYNVVQTSTMPRKKGSKSLNQQGVSKSLDLDEIEQQKNEGWDGTSVAIYRKFEGVI
ncbi:slit homolog 1 protein isoform X2 [Hydra vulgaris]|uniref:slit homolog 1 protein isoform X2 n=1 Tax=Hydra vulgaris TaxID=6087 RepID=UPI001F5EC6B8|nr:slit homolog 1 protein isoform X2 [Hydra vulgaris]